ncbi:restriction endonuclease subunit S [Leyella stercorea]|uniref:restriction endonuclease subunit S n=1 Tax=Leyella stercorea TaxID=363265 RepID=UPI0040262B75
MKETKFKNTEIGKIPEEWKMYSIGKDCSVKARIGWQGLTTSEYLQTGHYGLITSTDLIEGKVNWDTCVFVSEERYKQDTNIIVKNGDVLVSKDGTIGKVAVVSNLQYPTTLNSGVFVIRTKNEKITQEGLGLVFISPYFKDFIKRLTAGSTIVHLYQKDIVNFTFPIPTLPEQHRIASALTSIDNLISSLGKLIEKKKNIKQGTMQQLLTGQIRLKGFSEPWGEKKLEEVCSVKRGVRVVKRNLTTDGLYPVYQNTNFPLGYSNQYNVEANTPFVIIGGSAGQVGICRERYWAADDCAFFACHDIYKEYLYYVLLLNQSNILHNVRTGTIPRLDRSFLSNMVVYISSNIDEQQAIATILTKMDDEITALEAKRAKYEAIKQGMMQQLLTGKIRLIS